MYYCRFPCIHSPPCYLDGVLAEKATILLANIQLKDLMKAFLSHSSLDKEFVQEVADQLGRVNCIFDKYSFSSGVEFQDSIIQHLGNSSVFVLFATINSLKSVWCDFEMASALDLKINKKIGINPATQ